MYIEGGKGDRLINTKAEGKDFLSFSFFFLQARIIIIWEFEGKKLFRFVMNELILIDINYASIAVKK